MRFERNQVQPAKARRKGAPKLKVFVRYAHANYKLRDRLKTHLDILKNERLVSWWFDGKIRPGSEWDYTIRKELREADIVILDRGGRGAAEKGTQPVPAKGEMPEGVVL